MGPASAEARWRLFVAIDVPEEIRLAVDRAVEPLRSKAPDATWTRPEAWHLTLGFLGWVDAQRSSDIVERLHAAASVTEPFTLRLDGSAGSFRGGVLWAGFEDCAPLRALADATRAQLSEFMTPSDLGRGFHAHLTLARARRGQRLPRELTTAYAGPRLGWTVADLVLYRSHLRRPAPRYEALHRAALGH